MDEMLYTRTCRDVDCVEILSVCLQLGFKHGEGIRFNFTKKYSD